MLDGLFVWMLLAGLPILPGVGVTCMFRCGERERRHMVWSAAVFLGALALWIGGNLLLGIFGLTWRGVSVGVLLGVVLVSGGVWITQALSSAQQRFSPSGPRFSVGGQGDRPAPCRCGSPDNAVSVRVCLCPYR